MCFWLGVRSLSAVGDLREAITLGADNPLEAVAQEEGIAQDTTLT